jgi:hypothetical protein
VQRVEKCVKEHGFSTLGDIHANGPPHLPKRYRLFFKRLVEAKNTEFILDLQRILQHADVLAIAVAEDRAVGRLNERSNGDAAAVGKGVAAHWFHAGPHRMADGQFL